MKDRLIKLLREANKITPSDCNNQWLEDLLFDCEKETVAHVELIPLIRGYAEGLYAANAIQYEDLLEFRDKIDDVFLAVPKP